MLPWLLATRRWLDVNVSFHLGFAQGPAQVCMCAFGGVEGLLLGQTGPEAIICQGEPISAELCRGQRVTL